MYSIKRKCNLLITYTFHKVQTAILKQTFLVAVPLLFLQYELSSLNPILPSVGCLDEVLATLRAEAAGEMGGSGPVLTWLLLYTLSYKTHVQLDFRWFSRLIYNLVVILMYSRKEAGTLFTYSAILDIQVFRFFKN